LPFLDAQWEVGCRNGAELWRRLRALGFSGSTRVVSEWATRRRRSERMTSAQLGRPLSARTIARLMTLKRDHLTKAETLTVAAIAQGAPSLAEARTLIDRFQSIVRRKAEADLDPWLQDAGSSLIVSPASGISKDLAAVRAAVTEPWSNGQTERHANRLNLVKRQMYGRAKLDLLEVRLVEAPDRHQKCVRPSFAGRLTIAVPTDVELREGDVADGTRKALRNDRRRDDAELPSSLAFPSCLRREDRRILDPSRGEARVRPCGGVAERQDLPP
jgi:hypothetical protein